MFGECGNFAVYGVYVAEKFFLIGGLLLGSAEFVGVDKGKIAYKISNIFGGLIFSV